MAIYHFSTNVHSRGKSHSAVSAAAYRSGERLYDERLGQTYDWKQYRRSHGAVLASEIFLPDGADEKYRDREIEASLPHEMSDAERLELARLHALALVKRYGTAVDMNTHAPHPNGSPLNYHVHFLMTTRELQQNGFGQKCELELSGKKKAQMGHATGQEQIKEMRKMWSDHVNRQLERGGHKERVDERSFQERGIDRVASQHQGPSATAMERRGEKTRIGDKNREAEVWNRDLAELEWQEKVIDLAIEREKRRMAEEKREREAEKAIRLEAREIRKTPSFSEGLDRILALEDSQQRRRLELEERLKQTYARGQMERLLPDAQDRVARSDTFFGRLLGSHRAALDDVSAYRKNLENIDMRQGEQRDTLERQLKAERERTPGPARTPPPQPERTPEPEHSREPEPTPRPRTAREMLDHFERSASPANDNKQAEREKPRDRGRDPGGYER